MGIETNFGKYLENDIISLATLSFDKRRSEFFTEELLILLRLVDKKIIDKNILYGSCLCQLSIYAKNYKKIMLLIIIKIKQ